MLRICPRYGKGDGAIGVRSTSKQAIALREASTRLSPVWPNLPSAEAFLPVVSLLVVVLPGLVAILYGGLTSNAAYWGRAGQDVLAGDTWLLLDAENSTPPLFAWCSAMFQAYGIGDPFVRLSLPSYLFWLLSAAVIYQLVQCWFDSNTALLTCLLLAVNPVLLAQVQNGEPGTCVLFWATLGLWAYVEHSSGSRAYPWVWILLGGFALGGLILSIGLSAMWLPFLTTVHLVYEQFRLRSDRSSLIPALFHNPTFRAAPIVGAISIAMSGYWLWHADLTISPPTSARMSLGDLVLSMPCTIVLAGFGLLLLARLRMRRVGPERQSSMPVLWAFAALAAFAVTEQTASGLLVAAVPLTLLAVRTLEMVVDRRLRDRVAYWLVLVTFWVFVLSRSPALVSSASRLVSSWLSSPEAITKGSGRYPDLGWQLFEIHLAVDALIAGSAALAFLYGISGRRDRFRRILFGGFAMTVVAVTIFLGVVRLIVPTRTSDAWRAFYQSAVEKGPFDWYVFLVLGDLEPPSELEFLARSLCPVGERFEARVIQEIDGIFQREAGRPLVIADRGRYTPGQFKIARGSSTVTLTPIHDGQSVVAYAIDEESVTTAAVPGP